MKISESSSSIAFRLFMPLLLIFFVFIPTLKAEQEVNVCLLILEDENEVNPDKVGRPQKFMAEVIEHIGLLEGWKVNLHKGGFEKCYTMLENDEADFMLPVVKTPARIEKFQFNSVPVLTSWARIFCAEDSDYTSMLRSLKGKTVAAVTGSAYTAEFEKTVKLFNLNCNIVRVDSIDKALAKIRDGEAYAAILERFIAGAMAGSYGVRGTEDVFNPGDVFYATLKGKNRQLLDIIDKHLAEMKRNKKSQYYTSYDKWLGSAQNEVIHHWYSKIILPIILGLLISVGLVIFLRTQIRKKTVELKRRNRQLEREISERRSAELALQESQQMFLSFMENLPAIAMMRNKESKVIYANRHAYELLGDNLKPGRTPLEFYPEELARKVMKDDRHALKHGPIIVEDKIPAKNGKIHVTETHKFPIRRKGTGDLIGIVGVDITRRLKALEDLRRSEENLSITLQSIGDAVIATDSNGNVVRMNTIAEKLTGWDLQEARGKPLRNVFKIVNAYSRLEVENPVDKVLSEGKIVGLANHTLLLSRNKQEYQIADSGAPIRDRDNKVVGVVLVFRDVTEEYRIQERLQQAQKMDSIGQLAGGVAHDFNNMLAGIIGASELLKRHIPEDNDRAQKYLGMMLDTAEQAAALTGNLLDFSRKGKKQSLPVEIDKIINKALDILARTIDRKIRITRNLECEGVMVDGDPSQLQNAILNLAVNARDAMPKGGELTISSSLVTLDESYCSRQPHKMEPGIYTEITVEDTGCGMDKSTVDRIFEPFFTTKDVGKGTGLGLPAVYGAVHDHHGNISVDSTPDVGSTFRIKLPAISCENTNSLTHIPDTLETGSGNILLVDDEEVIRTTVSEMLIKLGYDVTLASNGREAVDTVEKTPDKFDLVILDIVMPDMDGHEAYRHIREISPQAKVIVASGYSLVGGGASEIMTEGADLFIQKPYRIAELSRHLKELMN